MGEFECYWEETKGQGGAEGMGDILLYYFPFPKTINAYCSSMEDHQRKCNSVSLISSFAKIQYL